MDLTVTISEVQAVDPVTGQIVHAPGSLQIPGWALKIITLNKDFMIMEPGKYEVFLKCKEEEQNLGSTIFAFVSSGIPSSEQIAAMKSDPMSAKLVRADFGCKECPSHLRVYAGLERNSKLEEQGWLWHGSLGTEYVCQCGKTKFPLIYLRDGLAGALFRSTKPLSSNSIDLVRLYEVSALEQDCRDFKKLIDSNVEEERYQVFLEDHPIFLCRFSPKKLMHKKPVLSKHVVDFAVLNERRELILIEIEKPTTPLLKVDGGIRAELQHAISQVKNWTQVFEDHRAAALECIGLKLAEVAKVRGAVIAGRTPQQEDEARALRGWSWQGIELYTYDDLLHHTNEIIRHIATA